MMVLGHMVLCTHGFLHVILHVMEPIKGWEDFIVMWAWDVSGEGSLGHLG